VRVLIIEDERDLAEWTVRALEQSGMRADWASDARLGLARLAVESYDVLVLDLRLPDLDGREVLAKLRARRVPIPILVLTARSGLSERVSTLQQGADDFLAKPFAIEELEARLLALVRRARGMAAPAFECGALAYDPATRTFRLDKQVMKLSPREHALLLALIQKSGEPVPKQDLLLRVFSDDEDVQPDAIEVLVYRLRKRLAGSSVEIATLRGLGYCLEQRA
jgi:two-component system response regulator TctD